MFHMKTSYYFILFFTCFFFIFAKSKTHPKKNFKKIVTITTHLLIINQILPLTYVELARHAT